MAALSRYNFHQRLLLGTVLCGALFVALVLWRMIGGDESINFLSSDGVSEWILCPRNLDPQPVAVAELRSLFRRQFTLDDVPASATLSVRAFKRCEISLNGQTVSVPPDDVVRWKKPVQIEVGRLLKHGTNGLLVTTFNDRGQPAISLSLKAGAVQIATDESWQASFGGVIWHTAKPARLPIVRVDPQGGAVGARPAFAMAFFGLLAKFCVALGLVFGLDWFQKRDSAGETDFTMITFVGVAILWTAMFVNNLGLLPMEAGFDAGGHVSYISYIMDHGSFPLADQGWQMYHPPLYYFICAVLLKIIGFAAESFEGVTLVKSLGLFTGLAQIYLVLQILKSLFPANRRMHLAGLLLAACLPVNLYMNQFVNNEPLAALFVTFAMLLTLRFLERPVNSPLLSAAIGACLGASLLTKCSAIVVLPVFFVVLAAKALTRGERGIRFDKSAVMPALVCMVVLCGWHYWRVEHKFHNPLTTNFDLTGRAAYWQDEGYRTSAYYTRFGGVFSQPYNGTCSSFWDGLFSTLWGDGLCGGAVSLQYSSWDFVKMSAGYLLALFPSALIAYGLVITVWGFIRRPNYQSYLILGISAAALFLVFFLTLRVPAFSSAKASYALQAIAPLCILGAVGLEALFRRNRIAGLVLCALLLTWGMNSYRTFCIARGESRTYCVLGSTASPGHEQDARADLLKAIEIKPTNLLAKNELAAVLAKLGDMEGAINAYSDVLKLEPGNARAHLGLARNALMLGDSPAAIHHFSVAVKTDPDNIEANRSLAFIFATDARPELRNGPEAVRLAEKTCELTWYHDPMIVGLLALAYAENRQFDKAVQAEQYSSKLAEALGRTNVVASNEEFIRLFQSGQPFHRTTDAPPGTNAP